MYQTHDRGAARQEHRELGGYLLHTRQPRGTDSMHHYTVCDYVEAIDLGRSAKQLRSLAPSYDETRYCLS
jgi:hypothetical protein